MPHSHLAQQRVKHPASVRLKLNQQPPAFSIPAWRRKDRSVPHPSPGEHHTPGKLYDPSIYYSSLVR